MSEHAAVEREQDVKSRKGSIGEIVDFGLLAAMSMLGGNLIGFSVKYGAVEVLVTLRVSFEGRRMVAFVASANLPATLEKTVSLARRNELRWKPDKYSA